MVFNTLKGFFSGSKPIITLFVLLLASLYLMSKAIYDSTQFGQLYSTLLIINIAAILLLLGLISKNLYQLTLQYRHHEPGSRLTARLVLMLVVLSVTPVSVVYYFSLDLFRYSIDSWFNVTVENALNDALELSRASLSLRKRELTKKTFSIADQVNDVSDTLAAIKLQEIRSESSASEVTLFYLSGHIIASNSDEQDNFIPYGLDKSTQITLRQSKSTVELITLTDAEFYIRVAVLIPSYDASIDHRVVQAIYPITDHMSNLASSVSSAFSQYRELVFLRKPLRQVVVLTLSLVLLLTLLTAVWSAFFFSRRLVQPISDLVEGTRAVADGDYNKKLPVPGKDELGFLVGSFNQMTQKISVSQQQAEEQRTYLEAVLANLSSGVITLDDQHHIRTSNAVADQMLNCDLLPLQGKGIVDVIHQYTHLQSFFEDIIPRLDSNEKSWQNEVILFGTEGRRVLMCRGTTLPGIGSEQGGHVIVFDDITTLLQAQRDAAWGEVARRLAHEIKNPLTPIQLSAERLRHKYLDKNRIDDADLLDRSTRTIVHSVETLKEMVKAFSDYARMPNLHIKEIDLNGLILEILSLYKDTNPHIDFQENLDMQIPPINADVGRLRQLLHNLIKNALEAVDIRNSHIYMSTRFVAESNSRSIEIRVIDNGSGIPQDMLGTLFDPYVTNKPKGTGLGLAIVKKIVEEHGGMIWAENTKLGGAEVIIRLPVSARKTFAENVDESVQETDNNSNKQGNNNAAA